MTHPFAGIDEKLKRSNENIFNLKAEVDRFFETSKYPVIPKHDKKLILEAIQYNRQREIPLRFSVLVGEIVHHLRSILDHVVWQFSAPDYRRDHSQRIEFPILKVRPTDKVDIRRYEGKVKGIEGPDIRRMIEKLQPYNASDPLDCPLLLIHTMDVFDKHRELVLCHSTGAVEMPTEMITPLIDKRIASDLNGKLDPSFVSEVARQIQDHGKIIPMMSFKDFGRRKLEPVVPALAELHNEIEGVVGQFANKLPIG